MQVILTNALVKVGFVDPDVYRFLDGPSLPIILKLSIAIGWPVVDW